jgi:hypothetical protein
VRKSIALFALVLAACASPETPDNYKIVSPVAKTAAAEEKLYPADYSEYRDIKEPKLIFDFDGFGIYKDHTDYYADGRCFYMPSPTLLYKKRDWAEYKVLSRNERQPARLCKDRGRYAHVIYEQRLPHYSETLKCDSEECRFAGKEIICDIEWGEMPERIVADTEEEYIKKLMPASGDWPAADEFGKRLPGLLFWAARENGLERKVLQSYSGPDKLRKFRLPDGFWCVACGESLSSVAEVMRDRIEAGCKDEIYP